MILTQCAVCATELGLSLGKKCGRCSTRYCGPECQKQHWEGGGHDKLCKKIKKAGGAEHYNANEKYAEAVAVAAEKCADDTNGQTCYICTQALHWKTKEGLVRGCACRGTAGFAHVSCLAEQAKILVAEAEENNSNDDKWERWYECSLCEQSYHGVVRCALGWACWKTYVGRPEADRCQRMAMTQLGNGLFDANHHEDALAVYETEMAIKRRLGASEHAMIRVKSNLASTFRKVGRLEEALQMRKDVYFGFLTLNGKEHRETLVAANNYGSILDELKRFEEAKTLLRETVPVARRIFGDCNELTLRMRFVYTQTLYLDEGATLDDLRESVATLEELDRTARRVLGAAHPITLNIEQALRHAQPVLRARETPPMTSHT